MQSFTLENSQVKVDLGTESNKKQATLYLPKNGNITKCELGLSLRVFQGDKILLVRDNCLAKAFPGTVSKRAASWENQQCDFRTGLTQTGLYSHRSRLEALNFGFKEKKELYYPCSENKGADQLRGYCEADLRL